jgi:hypothetical protein
MANSNQGNIDISQQEHQLLLKADIPIATVSATTKELLAATFNQPPTSPDEVVFSRAHYSMALACLLEAYRQDQEAWLVDPTNYVTGQDWQKLLFTEKVARLVARHEILKDLKNSIDARVRNQLPISDALKGPLLQLFKGVIKPILSLHYEAGNKLVAAGHRVVQVVTDPHVRPQYRTPLPPAGASFPEKAPAAGPPGILPGESRTHFSEAEPATITYCVFDSPTKQEFIHLAQELGKTVNPNHIVVTGPPVDLRIINDADDKTLTVPASNALRLAITTGGVGTNYGEIKTLLSQIKPEHFQGKRSLELLLHAGLHHDFASLYRDFSQRIGIPFSDIHQDSSPLRLIHTDSLVEANELLIDHVFPWADAIITKPSGDMAYDAAAAHVACLFLDPLGPWEQNIQDRFVALGIGHDLDVNRFSEELDRLLKTQGGYPNFFAAAAARCAKLPDHYTHGCQNIINVVTSANYG